MKHQNASTGRPPRGGSGVSRPRATPPPPPAPPASWTRLPFTVWEGEKGGSARGLSYRTRLRAIIAAWWASLYSGHDVWIERDMPRAEIGYHPMFSDTFPPPPETDDAFYNVGEGAPPPPAPPRRWARGAGQ